MKLNIEKIRQRLKQSEKWRGASEQEGTAAYHCLRLKVEKFQEQLDTLHTILWDKDERISTLATEMLNAEEELFRYKNNIDCEKNSLKEELKSCEANRKYALDHIHQQNQLIQEAKTATEKLRKDLAQLVCEKVNSEHLAKQVVLLSNKNSELEQQVKELRKDEEFLRVKHAQEMNAFKDQNSRLIQEKCSMECPGARTNDTAAMCGTCLSCKSKKEEIFADNVIGLLDATNEEKEKLEHELSEKTAMLSKLRTEYARLETIKYNLLTVVRLAEVGLMEIRNFKGLFVSNCLRDIAGDTLHDIFNFRKDNSNLL